MRRRTFMTGVTTFGAAALSGQSSPAHDRWRVPPEEAPHEATFMMWPASRSVYPERWFLDEVQSTIAMLASTIADFEPVILLADAALHDAIRRQVSDAVTLWDVPTEDLWARDAGPLFAVRGDDIAVAGIQFNGWGEKQVHRHDGRVAEQVAARLGLNRLPTQLYGEPGGADQDGHGLLIAHESSWVIDNRNPGMDREAVGAALRDAYGADRLIWAPGLRDMDITDYHIDSLARFTGPGRILMNLPETPYPGDPFHDAAFETHDILRSAGLDLEVIPEPVTRRVRDLDFVASYVNFYVCNGAVIAAEFGDRDTDNEARAALARHYPEREIVMVNADALGMLGGGIHCATQQMPA